MVVDVLGGGVVAALEGLAGGALDLGLLGLNRFGVRGLRREAPGHAVAGRQLQQLVEQLPQLVGGDRPLEQRHRLPGDEGDDGGHGRDLERPGDLRSGVDVHPGQLEAPGVLLGQRLELSGQVGGDLGPRGVEDDHHRHPRGGLGDLAQVPGVDVDDEGPRHGPLPRDGARRRTGARGPRRPGGARGRCGRCGPARRAG